MANRPADTRSRREEFEVPPQTHGAPVLHRQSHVENLRHFNEWREQVMGVETYLPCLCRHTLTLPAWRPLLPPLNYLLTVARHPSACCVPVPMHSNIISVHPCESKISNDKHCSCSAAGGFAIRELPDGYPTSLPSV